MQLVQSKLRRFCKRSVKEEEKTKEKKKKAIENPIKGMLSLLKKQIEEVKDHESYVSREEDTTSPVEEYVEVENFNSNGRILEETIYDLSSLFKEEEVMTIVKEEDIGYDLLYLFGEDDQEELGYDLVYLFGEDDQEVIKDQKAISLMTNFKVEEATWNWRIQDKTAYDLAFFFL